MRLITLIALTLFSATAFADSPLTTVLDGLEWGDSSETVLSHHRERILEEYRTEIAGIRDPIEIDRMRRDAEDTFLQIEASHTVFSGARTGYEVSVIQHEVRSGADQSVISVRDDWSTFYYVFVDDSMQKLIVTYDQASMGFVGFEAFVERLESALGGPTATDWEVDDIGVRHMTRSTWEDDVARVRAEDKSDMFASFLLVYMNVDLVEENPGDAVAGPRQVGGSRDIGALMRRMDEEAPAETRNNENVVDGLLGTRTEVDLLLPEDGAALEGEEGMAAESGVSAMDDEEELEDEERRERPTRSSSSSSSDDREEEEEEEEGEIIY